MQEASTSLLCRGARCGPGSQRSERWRSERGAARGLASPSCFPLAGSLQVHRFPPWPLLWKRLSCSSSLVAEGVSQQCYSFGLKPPTPVRPHSSPSLGEEHSGVRSDGQGHEGQRSYQTLMLPECADGSSPRSRHLQTTQLRRELAWSLPKCPVPPEEWFSRHHSQSAELPLKLEPEKLGPLRSQVMGSPP